MVKCNFNRNIWPIWSGVELAFLLLKCSIVCHSVCTLLKCSIWLHCNLHWVDKTVCWTSCDIFIHENVISSKNEKFRPYNIFFMLKNQEISFGWQQMLTIECCTTNFSIVIEHNWCCDADIYTHVQFYFPQPLHRKFSPFHSHNIFKPFCEWI